MALRLNSSSSNSILSPSSFSHETQTIPKKKLLGIWVCTNDSRVHRNKHFELKASYAQPFNAVSLQAGAPVNSLTTERIENPAQKEYIPFLETEKDETTLSIVVIGASGDLSRRKIFPALFALFNEDRLPENFIIFGYARSIMTDKELRNMISKTLTCRVDKRCYFIYLNLFETKFIYFLTKYVVRCPDYSNLRDYRENCNEKIDAFLKRCFYHSGQYSSEEHFLGLHKKLKGKEAGRRSNRLFYLAVPPNMFVDVARCAKSRASSENGWTRVIIEKPFGRDTESSMDLTRGLKGYLREDQIFRIDHHMGKELVENLLVLRFSNLVFEPLWSRNYIHNVQLIFSEDFGIEGQGRYFDNYGVIRDIMQNHLLQTLALFAMDTPVSLDAKDIRNEKVKVLRSMNPVQLEDVVVGQYKGDSDGNTSYPAYTDEMTVSKNSLTPTFAAATLFINNARWDGVPFLMIAGKALHSKRAEIRVQFKNVPGNLYNRKFGTDLDQARNELVIRIEPDEAIYLKFNNKVPGLGMRLDCGIGLNLLYKAR
ncbi:hypothetical protein I3843_04G186000 [Carya illinoinensis]|nr:hypothetical protein I3843_04G186000 [Carya illinoinensis]